MIGPTLLKAIAAAQADARPLNKSELGGTQQPRHPADPQERWWYFPPSPAVHREIRRLCAAHGLAIVLLSATTGAKNQVSTRWLVAHVESGESMTVDWDAPPMLDMSTPTHGVAATVQHIAGYMPRVLLSIPAREAREGEEVVEGVIVPRSPAVAPTPPDQQLELEALGSMPGWAGGGGLVDPGPLGGEDVDDGGEAERADLAGEADAAVAGLSPDKPGELVDNAALIAAVKRRGERLGLPPADYYTAAMRAALSDEPGVDPRRMRPTPERRAKLVAHLQAEGDLP